MASEATYCYTYDVFLSFKSKETRKNFTGHLYQALTQSGIHTFSHDYDLPIGSDITKEIPKAIQESMVFIIVFSKEYVSSSQCLDELVRILDSKGQLVLPVYYSIDLAKLHQETEIFIGCGLVEYDVDIKKAKRWHPALTQVANLSGWDLQNISKGYLFGTTFNSLHTNVSSSIVCPRLVALFTKVVSFVVKASIVSSSFMCSISKSDLSVCNLACSLTGMPFENQIPVKTYEDLSEGIVHYTTGLPLVLEVLGASLYGRTRRKLWVSTLKKLKNIPPYQ
nr:TMV resistance protein N-like [Tanacetum cinerariifolium]